MQYPPRLKDGDKVGIVAPARKITPAQLDPALSVLGQWGLIAVPGNNIFSTAHSYLAGTDEERRRDLQAMIDDPRVKAIFCARGGYGSTRIIDDIDFSPLESAPKWFVGFSDITAFHLRLAGMRLASIHGTMPIFFGRTESRDSVDSIRKILFEGVCRIHFDPHPCNRPGAASGEVIGGNLSLVVDALHTPSAPDTTHKILLLEEVDEHYYRLDRMMTQLRRSGKLKDLTGLIIGHMTEMKESDLAFGEAVHEIVLHAVRDYDFPVAFSFPSGHQEPNLAWIHGGRATVHVGLRETALHFEELYRAET